MKSYLFILLMPFYLFSSNLITPIPKERNLNYLKVELGKMLFFDKRLSKDNTISCASCHDIKNGGDDGKNLSIGIDGKIGEMNAPTVLNSKFNFVQFWDGRAKTLQEQATGPIHNPVEMNTNFEEIISKLSKDEKYKELFFKIYKENLNEQNIIDAIVEFEKSLITPNSKFDRYLNGEKNILTQKELKGYELFKSYGCISCHNGINIGGNLFQKVGIIQSYYKDDKRHFGRYNITKKEEDKFYFKVPTLRNIEHTAPYLHDGSVNDLKSVLKLMLTYQVGTVYEDEDIENLEEFLKTLSGEIPTI